MTTGNKYKSPRIAKLVKIGLWIFPLVLSASAFAQTRSPGVISLAPGHLQATDILVQNRPLTPDELSRLIPQQDISLLEPMASAIWQNRYLLKRQGLSINPQSNTLGVSGESALQYIDVTPSVVGSFRILVRSSEGSNFYLTMNKDNHNYLMRRALLQKIGYILPPVQYMAKVSLRFSGTFEKGIFLDKLKKTLLTSHPEVWVTNLGDTTSALVDLQDVVLSLANLPIFDLADVIPSQIPQGRRIMNSLVVPFSLTNSPESVNSFSLEAGQIYNEELFLSCPLEEGFSASFEDAKWILRRINYLDRADFQEIVGEAHYPEEVSTLMVEKLIQIRNSFNHLFDQGESEVAKRLGIKSYLLNVPDLPVHLKVTQNPPLLVDGQLQESHPWPGYATHFSGQYPDDPVSASQIFAFIRSRIYGSVVTSLVNRFNKEVSTDPVQQNSDKLNELATHQALNYLKTGTLEKIPKRLYTFVDAGFNVTVSREIVVGSYFGSDNKVQLADNIGIGLKVGQLGFLDGLSTVGLSINPFLHVSASRIYSHIRPIDNIQLALQTDFKNIFVPVLKSGYATILDPIMKLPATDQLSDEQIDILNSTLQKLDAELATGESILITDSYGGDFGTQITYGLSQTTGVQGQLGDQKVWIRRLQILKQASGKYQIYFDPGTVNELSIGVSLDIYKTPVVNLSASRATGQAQTNFFTLDLTTDSGHFANVIKNAAALRTAFTRNSATSLRALQHPQILKHEFKQKIKNAGLLFFKGEILSTKDHVTSMDPSGFHQDFYYRNRGTRTGKDYQTLALNSIQGVLQTQTGSTDYNIDTTSSGNPADTFLGDSIARNVNFQVALNPTSSNQGWEDVFSEITHLNRGWEVSKKNALKMIQNFNKLFLPKSGTIVQNDERNNLFHAKLLNDAEKLKLYAIQLDIRIYKGALVYLSQMDSSTLKGQLQSRGIFHFLGQSLEDILRDHQNFVKAMQSGDGNKIVDLGAKLIDELEKHMPGERLVDLLGGPSNVFVQIHVSGFRTHDEQGIRNLSSNSLGIIGSEQSSGPLTNLANRFKISNGEFYLYWLLSQI